MTKKAQGLSINVIIIAAIALIILVVLIAIFTGRLGSFSAGVSQTVTCENSCKAFGMDDGDAGKSSCEQDRANRFVPGDYADVDLGCCCVPKE